MHAFLRAQHDDHPLAATLASTRRRFEQVQFNAERANRRALKDQAKNVEILTPRIPDLESGRDLYHLDWGARLYLHSDANGAEELQHKTNPTIALAMCAGWERVARSGAGVSPVELGTTHGKSRTYYFETCALVGLEMLLEKGELADGEPSLEVALAALVSIHWLQGERRESVLRTIVSALNRDPLAAEHALYEYWRAMLDEGVSEIAVLTVLAERNDLDFILGEAIMRLLRDDQRKSDAVLRICLKWCVRRRKVPLALVEQVLTDDTAFGRMIWINAAFALDPIRYGDRFRILCAENPATAAEQFRLFKEDAKSPANSTTDIVMHEAIIRSLGVTVQPREEAWWSDDGTALVMASIHSLQISENPDSLVLLHRLVNAPLLADWRAALLHAHAQCSSAHRERRYHYATLSDIRHALSGGPPTNAADLFAIVVELLRELQRDVRQSDTSPWKAFWSRKASKVTAPLIENECRGHLLERLKDRLKPFRIATASPEAARALGSRTDVLVLTHQGRSLPLEAKRHWHPDLWIAPSTQLLPYTEAQGSEGLGIYLVFWFGGDQGKTPSRPDHRKPTSAVELEEVLIADNVGLKGRIEFIVLDLSPAPGAKVEEDVE